MNDFCKIGLHSFGDWEDKGKLLTQTRICQQCRVAEERQWQPDEEREPHDPYQDLTR